MKKNPFFATIAAMVQNIENIYKSYDFIQRPAMRKAIESYIKGQDCVIIPSQLFFAKEKMHCFSLFLKKVWFWIQCVFSKETRERFANGCQYIQKRFTKLLDQQLEEKTVEKEAVQEKWKITCQKITQARKIEQTQQTWKQLAQEYQESKKVVHAACLKNDAEQTKTMDEIKVLSEKINAFDAGPKKLQILELKAQIAHEELACETELKNNEADQASYYEYGKQLIASAASGLKSYISSGIAKIAQLGIGAQEKKPIDLKVLAHKATMVELKTNLDALEKSFLEAIEENENRLFERLQLNQQLTQLQKTRFELESKKAEIENKISTLNTKIAV